jgi:hypothetical protein
MSPVRCLIALCPVLAGLAQSQMAPELVQLAHIRQHMVEHLTRIVNLTCLETIERNRSDRGGRMGRGDTLRLEVAIVDGKELFSKLGEEKFEDRDIRAYARGGAMESGLFATLAHGVFMSKWPTYRYAGEEILRGRRALKYNYEVPLLGSGYQISIANEHALVGFSGAFWADEETLQLLRLTVHADDIPLRLGLIRSIQTIDYGRVRMNETDFLLPQHAETTLYMLNGSESRNRTEFTHWLKYESESTLIFDDNAATAAAAAAAGTETSLKLPAGLAISTRLETEIRSDRGRVGDPITAKVDQDAVWKGNKIVPAGATLVGRIRAFEAPAKPTGEFTVALEFYELQVGTRRARFFGKLAEMKSASSAVRKRGDEELLGVGTLQVRGKDFRLSHELRLVWKMGDF